LETNKKNSRRIIIISIVIILIGAAIFLVVNKNENDKIKASNKNKAAINAAQVKKNSDKTSKDNSTTDTTKSSVNGKSVDNKNTTNKVTGQTALQKQATILKQQNALIAATQKKAALEKIETAKAISSKDGIVVFIKAANFGSMAEIVKDNSRFGSYKYYQFFLGNNQISKVESITKSNTTIFPAQEVGTEVEVGLLGQDKKVIKKVKVKLTTK